MRIDKIPEGDREKEVTEKSGERIGSKADGSVVGH